MLKVNFLEVKPEKISATNFPPNFNDETFGQMTNIIRKTLKPETGNRNFTILHHQFRMMMEKM